MKRRALLGLAVLTAGCCHSIGGNPLAVEGGGAGTVVVGSADFPENRLLAEVYGEALKARKIKVSLKLSIGSREVLFGLVKQGALTVIPEYNGALLAYLAQKSDDKAFSVSTQQTDKDVTRLLPAALAILKPAPAQDNDSLTITRKTSRANGDLTSLEQIKPYAGTWIVGGPATFQSRFQDRFKSVYGVEFKEWRDFGSASTVTVQRLVQGVIQGADLFTTDPAVQINDLVSLADPKGMFGVQNIIPLVHRGSLSTTASGVLDAVSAKLTTGALIAMMKRVSIDKDDTEGVAADWLKSQNLD